MLECSQDKQFFVLVQTETNGNCFSLYRETEKNLCLFWCFATNQNKKSVLQNKPKLKINTLLFNGHGCGNGHGRGKGHRNRHDLFVLVFFAKLKKNIWLFRCFRIILKQTKTFD
jgi:hypothetical protein